MEYLNLTTPYGQTYEVCFEAERYANNHNLALQLYFKDEDGMLMPFSTLTINLREPHEPNCSFVDTNDNPWAEKFITDNKLGKPTGRKMRSGYCEYPQYQFDLKEIEKYQLNAPKPKTKDKSRKRDEAR